jgi:hypothetical protein
MFLNFANKKKSAVLVDGTIADQVFATRIFQGFGVTF